MTPAEIEALLQEVILACDRTGHPLNTQQRETIFRLLIRLLISSSETGSVEPDSGDNAASPSELRDNPLTDLTAEQRQALLQFIQDQKRQNRSWKAQLLNNWLYDRQSETVEFIQQQYGLSWLEQIQPEDIAEYADEVVMRLQVGDRIEISNGLWEWVQTEDGPCQREWVPCTVIDLVEVSDSDMSASTGYSQQTNCIIRFSNGQEYEIQGVYEWNCYNWRWADQRNLSE
jgi:hypothetical protein